jgi:hypothetical protein
MLRCSAPRRLLTREVCHERALALKELRDLFRAKEITIEGKRARVRRVHTAAA